MATPPSLDRTDHTPGTISYVAPFVALLVFLAISGNVSMAPRLRETAGIALVAIVLWFFSRSIPELRPRHIASSTLAGGLVFILWIFPDWLAPGYRHSILFENPLTGMARSSLSGATQQDGLAVGLRTLRAVILVPVAEELFWRGWLMRWIVRPEFTTVKLGAYTPLSFWLTSALFASEHGPYWDVGLITGVIYNAWMIRVKNLGDAIIMHAVTNACLSAYVIVYGKWEYWL